MLCLLSLIKLNKIKSIDILKKYAFTLSSKAPTPIPDAAASSISKYQNT